MKMHVERIRKEVPLPYKQHEHDAAFDLFSAEEVHLEPGERARICTGIRMGIPQGHVGLISEDRKSTRLNSSHSSISYALFFFNDTATTEIYTLSLHDALPISLGTRRTREDMHRHTDGYPTRTCWTHKRRSEEHTSELQSQFHLVCPLFF